MSDHADPETASPAAYAASPAVVFRQMDDGAVLLDLESGVYFGLDEVGTRVWTLLLERGTSGATSNSSSMAAHTAAVVPRSRSSVHTRVPTWSRPK